MHLTHSSHDTAFLDVVNFSRPVRCLSKLRTLDTHSLLHRLLCNVLLGDFRTNSNPSEWHKSWRRLLCVSNESHAHEDTGLLSEAAALTRVNKMEMAGSWPRFIVGRTLNCSTCTWSGGFVCGQIHEDCRWKNTASLVQCIPFRYFQKQRNDLCR